jgi:hypothetical protein
MTAVRPEQEQSPSCSKPLLDLESQMCATGTAWGLLDGQPMWVLTAYFCFRHVVYFSIFIALFFAGVNVYIPLVVVFAVAHSWKFSLFMRNGKEHVQKIHAPAQLAMRSPAQFS